MCSTFNDIILDSLGFSRKLEMVFSRILCKKGKYRPTFELHIENQFDRDEHSKFAGKVKEKIVNLNRLRNTCAHSLTLTDAKEFQDVMVSAGMRKDVVEKVVQSAKEIVEFDESLEVIDEDFKLIKEFFTDIKFKY